MAIPQNDWAPLLEEEFEKPYYLNLRQFLAEEYRTKVIHPDKNDIFNALHLTSFAGTKVVILGQDPYHGRGQAHGLSFSVQPGVAPPPSLRNIFKELKDDLGCRIPDNGHLTKWAEQGVLLLNTVMTVRENAAHSHRGKGWELFTDRVISLLNSREKPVVFLLWGKPAQEKRQLVTEPGHRILQAPHPSPFSADRGFFGSRPFSQANGFLQSIGSDPIDWQIPDIHT